MSLGTSARTCTKGHKLVNAQSPFPTSVCDVCFKAQDKATLLWSCRSCNYDICGSCFAAPAGSAVARCSAGHPFSRSTNTGNLTCNDCELKMSSEVAMYGCQTCKFDLCVSCLLKRQSVSSSQTGGNVASSAALLATKTCHSGHTLSNAQNPYPQVVCDVCLLKQGKTAMLWSCRACNFDMCRNCYSAPKGSVVARKCPRGHPMSRFTASDTLNLCTTCQEQRPSGSTLYGCRACKHSSCLPCFLGSEALPLPKPTTESKIQSRLLPESEADTTAIPSCKWTDVAPNCGCLAYLRASTVVCQAVPRIVAICEDIEFKATALEFEMKGKPNVVILPRDEAHALIAYTHDLQTGTKDGNLYFELNKSLRQRAAADRETMKSTWGIFMYFMMRGLEKLPAWRGTVYRGYPAKPNKQAIFGHYEVGRPIQWGAFTSTTTNFGSAKNFTSKTAGIIFKIVIRSGRDINAYSFFPQEFEIILGPGHRFTVSSEPYEQDGYTVIDMVEQNNKDAFIS